MSQPDDESAADSDKITDKISERESSAVLPTSSERESSSSWGDGDRGFDDDWYLSERPPHHG